MNLSHLMLILIPIGLIMNCSSTPEKSIDYKGNWRTTSFDIKEKHEYAELRYTEFYFTSDSLFLYDEDVGYHKGRKYYVQGDTLFTSLGSEFVGIGKVSQIDTKLVIEMFGDVEFKMLLERINSPPTLEDFIKSQVSEENYYSSFLKRYEAWLQ